MLAFPGHALHFSDDLELGIDAGHGMLGPQDPGRTPVRHDEADDHGPAPQAEHYAGRVATGGCDRKPVLAGKGGALLAG
jgi:hypothetical protein